MENVCNVESHDVIKDRDSTCTFMVALEEFLLSSEKNLKLSGESSLLHCNKQHFRHKTLRNIMHLSLYQTLALKYTWQHEICLQSSQKLKCIYVHCIPLSITFMSSDLFC